MVTAMNENAVVVGLSGGVDSAVTAKLLMEQGYAVTGVYLDIGTGGTAEAAAVADFLRIPFRAVPIRDRLEEQVCAPFAQEYLEGRTPLPCARCNRLVKFPSLLEEADRIGAFWVATGHYAQARDGLLFRGQDPNDQSYLLARLTADQLRRIQFPLGGIAKDQVRNLAETWNLPVAKKAASMEICFIPEDDYAAWLEQRGCGAPPGDFVDPHGQVLGRHRGIHCYTLGQRRGLGVSAGHRLFVSAIDPETNRVTLSDGGDLYRSRVLCDQMNWLSPPRTEPFPCQIRLRHSRRLDTGLAVPLPEGGLLLRGDPPFRAPTPGQLAVLYEGDQVLGSAWIQSAPEESPEAV